MLPNQPSRTLLGTAIRRATHQLLDAPLILTDPIALQVLPEASDPSLIAGLAKDGTPEPALLRSLFAMRSRFAEDRLAEAAARGVCQYVMVGAGLDTFPWRQPVFACTMQLFAADHPTSLAFAQERTHASGLMKPANLAYVPVDLEQRHLGERLAAHGFDPALPSFCTMLGVAQYLTAEAVDAVLEFVASLPSQSEIVFSFALPDDELSGYDREAAVLSAKFTASVGEPWRIRLRPQDLIARLRGLGFAQVFHLTPALAQQRYFGNRPDNLRAPGWEQLIAAVV
jgi:methyltransferase (TIGR00027 family)